MSAKLIIIDLDGATFDVIKPLVDSGRLPNFKKLLSGGVHGNLQSTIPAITPCAYSSFITGKWPRNTGIFDFVFKSEGENRLEAVNSNVLDGVPFWEIINYYGKKVGIINLPMTYPASKVDGFMIGCGLTAADVENKDFFHPADIFDRNKADRSGYILKPEWKTMRYRSNKRYHEEVKRMFEARTDLTLKLIKNEPWDFFMVHIHAIDWIQHSFWHDTQKVHDIHEKVDGFIGRVMDLLDKDTNIIIMSDHGFGPTHRTLNLSRWLIRENFLKTRNISFEETYGRLLRKVFRGMENPPCRFFRNLYGRLPAGLKSLFDTSFTTMYENLPFFSYFYSADYMNRIDWEKTLAYTYGQIGAIYINVKNDPSRYKEVRESITRKLYELQDENGEKLVQKVYTKEELFSGSHEGSAPDLLIYPCKVMYFHPDLDIKGVVSAPVHWRNGNHARQGVFIAYGNNINPGEFIGPIDIVDVTPTMLYGMGLPVLKTMDGKIAKGCFTSEYVKSHEPLFIEEELFRTKKSEPCEDNTEEIKAQLKGLGYI